MSSSRIKTVVIAALVLINVFFLAFIIRDAAADARNEREAIENVCAIFKAQGIMISPEDVRTGGTIRTMKTSRVLETEEVIAQAILGPTVISDQGVIYLYENAERGSAEFASAGDFNIRLKEGVITNANGTLRTVEELLRDMGLESAGMTVTFDQERGIETVTVPGAYREARIFNCSIEFVFSDGNLQIVRGRLVAGIEPAEDDVVISHFSTALLGFLAEVRREEREDVTATRIYAVEPGYRHRVAGSFGEGVLAPAWLISTDAGSYIIDDATGEIWLLA